MEECSYVFLKFTVVISNKRIWWTTWLLCDLLRSYQTSVCGWGEGEAAVGKWDHKTIIFGGENSGEGKGLW